MGAVGPGDHLRALAAAPRGRCDAGSGVRSRAAGCVGSQMYVLMTWLLGAGGSQYLIVAVSSGGALRGSGGVSAGGYEFQVTCAKMVARSPAGTAVPGDCSDPIRSQSGAGACGRVTMIKQPGTTKPPMVPLIAVLRHGGSWAEMGATHSVCHG